MSKYMLVLHEVNDYSKWKPYFNTTDFIKEENGIVNVLHYLRENKNKNDVVILSEVVDVKKAQAFSESQKLKDIMRMAGVVSEPEIHFLSN